MKCVLGNALLFILLIACLATPAITIEVINGYVKQHPYTQAWQGIWKKDQEFLDQRESVSGIYDEMAQKTFRLVLASEPALKESQGKKGTQIIQQFSDDFSVHQTKYKELQASLTKARRELSDEMKISDEDMLTLEQSSMIYALFYVPLAVSLVICGSQCYGFALKDKTEYWNQKRSAHLSRVTRSEQHIRAEQGRLNEKERMLNAEVASRVKEELERRILQVNAERQELHDSAIALRQQRLELAREAEQVRLLQTQANKARQVAAQDQDQATRALEKASQKEELAAQWCRRIEAGVEFLQQHLATKTHDCADPTLNKVLNILSAGKEVARSAASL